MSGDYIEIPTERIREIGNKLIDISGMLQTVDGRVERMDGHDYVHGMKLAKAVDSFYRKWMKERSNYYTRIENYGFLSEDIAVNAEELDDDIDSAIQDIDAYIERPKGAM